MTQRNLRALMAGIFLISTALILYELLLTRLFAVVLFSQFAHLALALALLGMGVGAIAQHLWPWLVPAQGLNRRLGWIAVLQGLVTLLAVWASLRFPIMEQFEVPPLNYQERSSVKDDLLNPFWFGLLLPVLSAPFVCAGVAFSGSFLRAKERIGKVYGADLAGGAVGAVLFLPLLMFLSGPDVVFAIVGASGVAAVVLFHDAQAKRARLLALGMVLFGVTGVGLGLRSELIPIRGTAGYAEAFVTWSKWTPLVRLAVHEDERRGTYVLLDNTSASQIFIDQEQLERAAKEENRSMVYALHQPDARVAVLAASAGPEVAIARERGFDNIDAIDIASEIFDVVGERFADSPVNPYADGVVGRVHADGRAAILRAQQPYDIIQMVHANLWSSAGLLANTWSPSLLETQQAFETYLDKLSDDGTISFGRGRATHALLRSAVAALEARGVERPWQNIVYCRGKTSVLLVKKRAWTPEELQRVSVAIDGYSHAIEYLFPVGEEEAPSAYLELVTDKAVMTDDRPYLDTFSLVSRALGKAFQQAQGDEEPMAVLYRSVVIQLLFVLSAGLVFLGIPLVWRGRAELSGVDGLGKGILYIVGLGYGYLALEIILIHELVLFVGHPTYAITTVVLAMLLSSGIGSMLADRVPEQELSRRLRQVLMAVLVLGAFQAWVMPGLLYSLGLGLPLIIRILMVLIVLSPLGLLMGMPFSMAMRMLHSSASSVIPWFWAINGWMSVVASLLTVLIARLGGYRYAATVALLAYLLALLMVGAIHKLRKPEAASQG